MAEQKDKPTKVIRKGRDPVSKPKPARQERAKDPNSFDQRVQNLEAGESLSQTVRLPPNSTVEVIDDTVTRMRNIIGGTRLRAIKATGRQFSVSSGWYTTRGNYVVVVAEIYAQHPGEVVDI